jgi:hypothetical protein
MKYRKGGKTRITAALLLKVLEKIKNITLFITLTASKHPKPYK